MSPFEPALGEVSSVSCACVVFVLKTGGRAREIMFGLNEGERPEDGRTYECSNLPRPKESWRNYPLFPLALVVVLEIKVGWNQTLYCSAT